MPWWRDDENSPPPFTKLVRLSNSTCIKCGYNLETTPYPPYTITGCGLCRERERKIEQAVWGGMERNETPLPTDLMARIGGYLQRSKRRKSRKSRRRSSRRKRKYRRKRDGKK